MRFFLCLFALPLFSVTYTVNVSSDSNVPSGTFNAGAGTGDLRGCLNRVNIDSASTPGTYVIAFDSSISTITLNGMLPILNLNHSGNNLTINGSGASGGRVIIDGASTYPGFFAYQGTISLTNRTIQNTLSRGGNGSGGGLGAGGGPAAL